MRKIQPGFILLTAMVVCFACRKNEITSLNFPKPTDSLQQINRWMLDSMYAYYYWNTPLRSVTSLSSQPADFFSSLLHSNDKFSWAADNVSLSPPSSSQEVYGLQYALLNIPDYAADKFVAVVLSVTNGSSANIAGLHRGDFFCKINGQYITTANQNNIIKTLESSDIVTIDMLDYSAGNGWTEADTRQLRKKYFENRPINKICYYTAADKRTGYISCINFNEVFDADFFLAFEKFRQQNINELILDLRYNTGGSVASAAKLCAMIANVNGADVFGRYKGNSNLGDVLQSFEKAIAVSSNSTGKDINALKQVRPSLSRVFILTTRATMSSAEMVINTLKPYITVVQIGEQTFGKDMATATIQDRSNPKKIRWILQPLVFKLFNSANEGNYNNGLMPAYQVSELQELPLKEFGNRKDPLIAKALQLIYGSTVPTIQSLKTITQIDERKERTTDKIGMAQSTLIYNAIIESKKISYPEVPLKD